MASFQSGLDQFNQYQAPGDLNLINQTLAIKQNQYDVGERNYQDNLAQLKVQEGLLRRPEDKDRFAKNVQGLIDEVNSKEGGIDWAKRGLTNKINAYTNAAIDDYTIEQIGISQTIRAFNTEVAKKREKNDGSYADQNYIDAQERAGIADYDSGKTNKIGSLSYSDYVDVSTTQDKKAADYAKERGLKDQFLGRTSDAYETTDKFGVKVTREEIERYLESTMDVKTKNQLNIDTRQSVGKLDDKAFGTFMSSNQLQDNQELKNNIARIKAERDTVSDDKKGDYDIYLKDAQKKLDEGELKYKNGAYSRDEMYGVYSKARIRDIAANHDVDIITKIDTSDMPFEIMKFKTETELKMQEIALKKQANTISQNGSMGTMTETPLPVEEKQATKLQEQQQATYKSDQALDTYLKTNNAEYNNMTPEQQWNYKLKLNPNNPLATGNTTTLKNLVNTFQEAQGGYAKAVKYANKKITSDVEISYNNLINGTDLNIDNLGSTMPFTVSLLKTKKNFGSLSNEEKLGLVTEFASNNLQYGELDGDIRTLYEKVVVQNKSLIKSYGTTKSKQIESVLKNSTTGEVGGYFTNTVRDVRDAWNNVVTIPANIALRTIAYPFNLFGGEKYAKSQLKAAEDDVSRLNAQSDAGDVRIRKMQADYFGGEDTNITELEGRDTKDDKDIQDRFNTTANAIKQGVDEIAGSYQENRKTGQAFTFSTADKSQAPIAVALRAAVLNSEEKPTIPAGTNDYTVAREGNGYRISFISGSGKTAAYSSAYVAKLPPNVAGMYEESVQSWTNNPNNPNIKLTPTIIDAYVSPTRRNQDIKNLISNRDFSAEVKNTLATNPAQTAFATNSELKENIQKKYGDAFYKRNVESVNNILNNKYTAVPYVSGGNFFMKIQYTEDGEEKEYNEPQSLGTEKDDHGFYLAYMEATLKLKSDKINKLYTAE